MTSGTATAGWVPLADGSGGVAWAQNPPDVLTQKGDLLTQSAAGVYTRLPIGTSQILGTNAGLPVWTNTRERLQLAGLSLLAWSYDFRIGNQGRAMGSQVLNGTLIGLRGGDVVSNIVLRTVAGGAGVNPTGLYVALYTAAGVQIGVSANLAASAIWQSSGQFAVAPLTPAVTIAADGAYYACVLEDGAYIGTLLTLLAGDSLITTAVAGGIAQGVIQNGQATPPANAAFTANGRDFWVGVN